MAGIELLIDRKLLQPALVIIYSTMDAAAWLDVQGPGDVTRRDFVNWVERYALPGSELPCTGLELYGARCGLLHSLTAVSKLSREGRIRTLGYAWGTASPKDLDETARFLRRTDIVGVHIGDLRTALKIGLQSFMNDAAREPSRWANVLERARYLFSHLPRQAMTDALEIFRSENV
jgi:hypothetical protein